MKFLHRSMHNRFPLECISFETYFQPQAVRWACEVEENQTTDKLEDKDDHQYWINRLLEKELQQTPAWDNYFSNKIERFSKFDCRDSVTMIIFPKISPLVYMHYFSEILANLVFSIINLVLHGTGVFYEVEWQIWMIWRNKNENLKVKKCRCYKTLGTICSLRKCRWKANNYKWAHTSSYKIMQMNAYKWDQLMQFV